MMPCFNATVFIYSVVGASNKMERKIIHCDADCFYAAIEMRDNPSFRNRPLAVGGRADSRSVLSTCNYEARRYGIHSAMSSALAMRLCPQLLIVPHHMEKYKEASLKMRKIFHDYTDLVEPLSLDEAYIDVSACAQHNGSATLIAQEIRQRVYQDLNITVSAGVSNSKFLAKVASDWRKPNNIFVIPPRNVDSFIRALPVNKIHGVGKVTAEKLKSFGIQNCGDLRQFGLSALTHNFGSFGQRLYDLSNGKDDREVKPHRIRKSLSVEHTYAKDLSGTQFCLEKIPELLVELKRRLERLTDDYKVSKAFVKVKFSDFSTTTLERTGTTNQIGCYRGLMQEALNRKPSPVRLLGIGVRFNELLKQGEPAQMELFASH